jgi:solute carrier family 25 uncoupling protein 8/9
MLLFPTGGGRYSGPLAALSDILAKQGPSALMRGWLANYTRLGPQTTIAFLVAEQLRSMAGLPRL